MYFIMIVSLFVKTFKSLELVSLSWLSIHDVCEWLALIWLCLVVSYSVRIPCVGFTLSVFLFLVCVFTVLLCLGSLGVTKSGISRTLPSVAAPSIALEENAILFILKVTIRCTLRWRYYKIIYNRCYYIIINYINVGKLSRFAVLRRMWWLVADWIQSVLSCVKN